jgi:endonuclease YncB( thermonuclease family)
MIRTREVIGGAVGLGLFVVGVLVGATHPVPRGLGPKAGEVAPPGVGGGHECVEVTTRGRVFAVRRVIDGDTFVVEDYDGEPTSVRILGIDTPERGEFGHIEARDALAAILGESGMLVELRFDPDAGGGRKRDAFGRLLCEVVARERGPGGVAIDVGERLLERGHAVRYGAREE